MVKVCLTEHLRTARALRSREQRLEGIINTVADGIVTIDDKGDVQSFNAAAERMFKFKAEEIIGKNIRQLMPDSSDNTTQDETGLEWQRILKLGSEIEGKRKDGQTFPMEMAIRELIQGDQLSFTGVIRDISARKRAEDKIRHLAHHDALTGLPNRFLFGDRLDEAITRAHRHNSTLALMFLDLNKFKPINDTFGHAVGDKILIAIGERLKSTTRASDTVSRVGGDEFVVILEEVNSEDQVCKIAEKIISTINQPIEIDADQHSLSVSIGISIFPDHTKEADKLIHLADLAMYEAKRGSQKSYKIFESDS